MTCKCRNCGAPYDEEKSRADWKGYCSQACFHARARARGYQPALEKKLGRTYSEYAILNRLKEIGSIPYEPRRCPSCSKGQHSKHSYDFMERDGSVRLCRCDCRDKTHAERRRLDADPSAPSRTER